MRLADGDSQSCFRSIGVNLHMIDFIQNLDFQILDFIQQYIKNPALDIFFPVITYIGEYGWVWFALAITLFSIKKHRKTAVVMLISFAAAFLLGEFGIKLLVSRPRPFTYTDMELLIAPPSGFSFPSMHTMSSFCAATSVFLYNKKIGFPALILALLIAFSRLYLYVHFPSDVICGIIFGIIFAVVGHYSAESIIAKFKAKKKTGG